MTKFLKIPNEFKFVDPSVNTDQKSTIMGLLTLLSYEFEKIEFYDNQIFKQNLKVAANNFKKQLERVEKEYYKNKSPEALEIQMNVMNDLCHIIEQSINMAYSVAEMPVDDAKAYLSEMTAISKKYGVSNVDFNLE